MGSFFFWIVLPLALGAVALRMLYRRDQNRGGRGIVSAVHDFRFENFVAPQLVRAVYIAAYVLAVLVTLAWVLLGVSLLYAHWLGWALPVTMIVGAPLVAVVFLVLIRAVLEHMIVAFQINDKLRILLERGAAANTGAASTVHAADPDLPGGFRESRRV